MPRDYEVLRLLLESKTANRDQIAKYVFGDRSLNTVNIRLKKLERVNLIRGFPVTRQTKSQSAYSLTKSGLDLLKPSLPFEFNGTTLLSECVEHDTELLDIRKRLQLQSSVTQVFSENVLQSSPEFADIRDFRHFLALNSDGVIEIKIAGTKVLLGLEYDRFCRSKTRCIKKLKGYYSSLVDGVLYICSNKYIMNSLMKVDQQVSQELDRDSVFRFGMLHDVIQTDGPIDFFSWDGEVFSIV